MKAMTTNDLNSNEYDSYYLTYLNKTKGVKLKEGLRSNSDHVLTFLKTIPERKLNFQYAVGKWTVKEVIQHLIDTERIFSYRALRIARKDRTPLAGFDQDAYVGPSRANERTLEDLLAEYKEVRSSTISLFNSFTDEMLMELGTASNSDLSVRAAGFIIIGHENHHCEIIKERYL